MTPRWEYRCRPAHRLQEELLLPLSREEKQPQQPNNEGSPAPPRSNYTLCRQKDADEACCTHDSRRILHNGNRILWLHTPQWMRTASVSLPPFPPPENSSVAVADSPTCRKALVFLLPPHIAQQHHQTHVTPPFADSPQTRLPPHSSAHRHAVRKRHAAAPHDGAAQANTAPRHSVQTVPGHTEQVAPVNDSPLHALRHDSSVKIKQSALLLLPPPCTRFCLPHASSVTPGLSISRQNSMRPSTQQETL
ncbi:hypothetical protein MOQ_005492 [Trypanosoma cruzi marinkellei]|uniref:Uncharacterized protein n=1 Tax=Trypanosoma cruzi marinkellei TaxID=85056 RepID=K2MY16_TRYCR|nr:hypothetical protein MOQ_005492 [Trypanosoma cruzi marinkellei]